MPTDPITAGDLIVGGVRTTAWLWEKLGNRIADKAFRAVTDKWDETHWHKATENYRAKVRKLYGTMQIMGMVDPVPLDDIFTDVYLLDKPTAFRRFDIDQLKKKSADEDAPSDTERINGLRLAIEKGNLFILGKPGAGKTTFLKYLTIKAAEQIIDRVPIFVGLKQWSDSSLSLLDFISERFDVCDFPSARPFVEELLRSGHAMLLFDGLDEVNQESGQRDRQTEAMNSFIEKYDRTQCLITCRIAASDYSFKPFTYVELADFTEAQIRIFVGNWFRTDGKKDKETCSKFFDEFKRTDNQGLRDLARTPLLLTLLCLGFNETLTFPHRRVEIYQEALDALLKKWDSSRRIKRDEIYRKLSLGHKENMLARIARDTFTRDQYFISQRDLERQITDYVKNVPPHNTNEVTDGELILKAIEAQHGIFVERARRVYSFSHLTFQEYFTAKYLVDNAASGTLGQLIHFCSDGRWREVFLLTTSLLPDANAFIASFRGMVDSLILKDETILNMFRWSKNKANGMANDREFERENYLHQCEINYKGAFTGMLGVKESLVRPRRLEPDLAIALDRVLLLDRARAFALTRAFDSDVLFILARSVKREDLSGSAFDRAIDRALDPKSVVHTPLNLDRALAFALALAGDRVRNRASARVLILDRALALAIALARKLDLPELAIGLKGLWIPVKGAAHNEWRIFTDSLRTLTLQHRDLGHVWELNEEQILSLTSYFNTVRLLKDCLALATMPPEQKEAIVESLFLPPA